MQEKAIPKTFLHGCEHFILRLGALLPVGAVFIICSETKDYYSFIGNMRSNVKGRGRSTEG